MKTKRKKRIESAWFLLQKNIGDFKQILRILNHFYSGIREKISETEMFREEIIHTKEENLEIFLKKFGDYEYLVAVKIQEEENSRMDSWIHIDGVLQEREFMKEIGNLNHPVFSIPCISDLYNNSCIKSDSEVELNY